jgi:hypothetical protein
MLDELFAESITVTEANSMVRDESIVTLCVRGLLAIHDREEVQKEGPLTIENGAALIQWPPKGLVHRLLKDPTKDNFYSLDYKPASHRKRAILLPQEERLFVALHNSNLPVLTIIGRITPVVIGALVIVKGTFQLGGKNITNTSLDQIENLWADVHDPTGQWNEAEFIEIDLKNPPKFPEEGMLYRTYHSSPQKLKEVGISNRRKAM